MFGFMREKILPFLNFGSIGQTPELFPKGYGNHIFEHEPNARKP